VQLGLNVLFEAGRYPCRGGLNACQVYATTMKEGTCSTEYDSTCFSQFSPHLSVRLYVEKCAIVTQALKSCLHDMVMRTTDLMLSVGLPRMDSGPKSSSGTLKRVSRRSKYLPPTRAFKRRDSSDFAVPANKSNRMHQHHLGSIRTQGASTNRSCYPG